MQCLTYAGPVRREGAPLSTAGKRKFFHNGWLMLARIDKKGGGQHYIAHVRRRSCERSIFYNVISNSTDVESIKKRTNN